MAGLVATEGADMPAPVLPYDQDAMIAALLGANENTIVVLKDSAPMIMPWIDDADTVLEVWNQGAEDGHVVPELLRGVVNPSGKVPTTYARRAEDLMTHGDPVRYPGTDEGEGYPKMRYTEQLEVGYRWFQSRRIEPLFPFGFGLSYTTFEVSDAAISGSPGAGEPLVVTATVTNTGEREGAEVVQVYLGIPVEGPAAEAPRGVPEGDGRARRLGAGDDHGRPGRDAPPLRCLGLRRPRLRGEARQLHRVRRHLERGHPTHLRCARVIRRAASGGVRPRRTASGSCAPSLGWSPG